MSAPLQSLARSARYVGTLRLLTINDVYSALPVDGCGGWAMVQTLIARHRTPNSIVCINGDFLGGSALAEHHQGKNVIAIMNQLKTDLVVLGNHE
jgi:2',3'-cyclic-nucleotide 2'-phosphodiesterase (5'-nucleotidase family)